MTDDFNPSTPLANRLEALEKTIRAFNRQTRTELLSRLAGLGLRDRAKLATTLTKLSVTTGADGKKALVKEKFLYDSIRASLVKKGGDLEAVSISFARHGIFVERGVGKNRKVGSASASAHARPWLYPVLKDRVKILEDVLANEYADIVAAEVRLLIPGIIDTRIK